MRRWLEADADGGLRVICADYHEGVHYRDEFRVVGDDGRPLRAARLPDVAGRAVTQAWELGGSAFYIRLALGGSPVRVNVEPAAVGFTAATPCPRAENRRRKCKLCAADAAHRP